MSMMSYPPVMRRLVNELTKLPSIGEKSAVRLAYHLLTSAGEDSLKLADSIREAREVIRLCEVCFALTDAVQCSACLDSTRDSEVLCVVEKPADVIALERCGGFKGRYHVLHGLWSPIRGISPERTTLRALLDRIQGRGPLGEKEQIRELILSTSTTVEGDATALYIAQAAAGSVVRVTRIAQGLPKGGELEYADDMTLNHALKGRRAIGNG